MKVAMGDVPAFLYSFVSNIMLKTSSLGIISLTCAEYITVAFFKDGCPVHTLNTKIIAAVVICEFD